MVAPRVVRIGKDQGRIDRITFDHVEFTDTEGESGTLDLAECRDGWKRMFNRQRQSFVEVSETPGSGDAWNKRCVGTRGYGKDGFRVQFLCVPGVILEFESLEDAYAVLVEPLHAAGWHTFDAD